MIRPERKRQSFNKSIAATESFCLIATYLNIMYDIYVESTYRRFIHPIDGKYSKRGTRYVPQKHFKDPFFLFSILNITTQTLQRKHHTQHTFSNYYIMTLTMKSLLTVLLVFFSGRICTSYTPVSTTQRSRWTMYAPPNSPTSQTAPMIAQKMLKTVGAEQERGSNWRLSNSVLASCDTLPSFPTAHGILSPETVSRMNEMTNGGRGNEAVSTFLKTYRQNGPMSCLEMLSDPDILPHLTKAMRDIAL